MDSHKPTFVSNSTNVQSESIPEIAPHLTIQHLQSLPSNQQFQLQNLEHQLLMLSTSSISSLMKSLTFPFQVRKSLKTDISNDLIQIQQELEDCKHVLEQTEHFAWRSNSEVSKLSTFNNKDGVSKFSTFHNKDTESEYLPTQQTAFTNSKHPHMAHHSQTAQALHNNLSSLSTASDTYNVHKADGPNNLSASKSQTMINTTSGSGTTSQQNGESDSNLANRLHLFQLLNHKQKIESIMEIPSLMQSCISHDMYSEVWELHQYLDTLKSNYGETIPILRSLSLQSNQIMTKLISKIFHQLRAPKITVPQCLRFVTILRHLNLCTETELRIIFLQNRLKHLRDTQLESYTRFISAPGIVHKDLKDSIGQDSLTNLSKSTHSKNTNSTTIPNQERAAVIQESTVDVIKAPEAIYSSHVFEYLLDITRSLKTYFFPVITQYRALFQDSDDTVDLSILNSCVHFHVTLPYTNTVKKYIIFIQEAEKLARVAEEIQFTSQSLAKIGVDVRHQLDIHFIQRMRNILKNILEHAKKEFRQNLHNFTWEMTDLSLSMVVSSQQKPLLLYRPLTIFTNSLLTMLNELKDFPILQLKQSSLEMLEEAIRSAINITLDVKNNNPHLIKEKSFAEFVNILRKELPEYIMDCFSNVYEVGNDGKEAFFAKLTS